MYRADVAAEPTLVLGGLACAALACLFLTSTVLLALILAARRRSYRAGG